MNRQQKLLIMRERFIHPDSRYAEQRYSDGTGRLKQGTYYFKSVTGYCTHEPKHRPLSTCPDVHDNIFTDVQLRQHLLGEHTFAPYQIKDGNVKWVCIDIDGYGDIDHRRAQAMLREVVNKMNHMGLSSSYLVEASGAKGYHVWLFFDQPVDVSYGYGLGHTITNGLAQDENIHYEVYPKQFDAENAGYGNTVKLPLGIHQRTKQRCLFVNEHFEPYEDQWTPLRNVSPISLEWLESHITIVRPQTEESGETKAAPLCLKDIMETGASEGIRDESAFRLAAYLRDKGVPRYLAEVMLTTWNEHNTPPIDPPDLNAKIDQGYAEKAYGWRPCHNPTFDHVCRSACPLWQRKVDTRWLLNNENPVGRISRD